MADREVTLAAVGDICIGGTEHWPNGQVVPVPRTEPESAFALTYPFLRSADITFGNMEGCLSMRGAPEPDRQLGLRSSPETVKALNFAQFDLVSVANNHTMDFGEEAFLDTLELLGRHSIPYVGGGRNIFEARRPVVLERRGLRVAFVAFTTNIMNSRRFAAGPDRPGTAPTRVSPYLGGDQLNQEDLEAALGAVKAAAEIADVVVASCHWGISDGGTQSLVLHQVSLGRQLVDAGAGLVIGHHPHIQQGIEVYRGRPICYSLGNFIFDYSGSAMPKTTIAVEAVLGGDGVRSLRVKPTSINADRQPYFPKPEDPTYRSIGENVRQLSRRVDTEMRDLGDAYEIVLSA